jgi:tetratricopeptide (TPR) repeat protein
MALHRTPLRQIRWLGALCLAAGLVGARPALAVDGATQTALETLETRFQSQLKTLSGVADSVSRRSAFMSAGEAERRYEDAVLEALLGNNDQAALEFSILLRSKALANPEVRADAEWYLAETLFKLSSWSTAEAAYLDIVAQGQAQPFFGGAVRRLLELYGITGEIEKFYGMYDRYIATKSVTATDLIQYTVAKSFFRQEDWGRSKSLFMECCPQEPLASKARYLVGTILVIQNDLPGALPLFQQVAGVPVKDEETRDLVDLANLAIGRIRYEQGDYAAATDAYAKVARESTYFADQLNELVWTYIKQGAYEEALRAVEVFLLAFPDHQYTAQLKVLRGHLHMKRQRYEAANTAYEKVVAEYSPIRDVVVSVGASPEQPRLFFERLAQEDALDALDKAGLPPFAAEMLYGQEDLARVVRLRRDLGADRRSLDSLDGIVAELDTALLSGVTSLGVFRNTYETLRWLRNDEDAVAGDLVALEARWMAANADAATRADVAALARESDLMAERAAGADRSAMADADRLATQEAQVRAVQQVGFQVEQSARTLISEIDATARALDAGQKQLSDEDYVQIRRRLDVLKDQLRHVIQEVRPVQGATAVRGLMALAEQHVTRNARSDRTSRAELDGLRRRLAGFRNRMSEASARDFFARTDALWADLERLGARTDEVEGQLSAVEQDEIARIREEFAGQRRVARDLRGGIDQALVRTGDLGVVATREGFEELARFFDSSVVRADMGIVDVYWIRKTQLSDRIESLNNQRVDLSKETNKRFEAINARLEE